jgi:hypothetical protein
MASEQVLPVKRTRRVEIATPLRALRSRARHGFAVAGRVSERQTARARDVIDLEQWRALDVAVAVVRTTREPVTPDTSGTPSNRASGIEAVAVRAATGATRVPYKVEAA